MQCKCKCPPNNSNNGNNGDRRPNRFKKRNNPWTEKENPCCICDGGKHREYHCEKGLEKIRDGTLKLNTAKVCRYCLRQKTVEVENEHKTPACGMKRIRKSDGVYVILDFRCKTHDQHYRLCSCQTKGNEKIDSNQNPPRERSATFRPRAVTIDSARSASNYGPDEEKPSSSSSRRLEEEADCDDEEESKTRRLAKTVRDREAKKQGKPKRQEVSSAERRSPRETDTRASRGSGAKDGRETESMRARETEARADREAAGGRARGPDLRGDRDGAAGGGREAGGTRARRTEPRAGRDVDGRHAREAGVRGGGRASARIHEEPGWQAVIAAQTNALRLITKELKNLSVKAPNQILKPRPPSNCPR